MANLYEINEAIMNTIDLETGEIVDFEAFENLQMERTEKLENIALWYKNLQSEAEALKAEEKAFADRRKSAESKAESLKNYLNSALNGQPFKTVKASVSFRKSKSLQIIDESVIPKEYFKIPDPVVSKTDITNDIKNGKEIPGVELKENLNISIK